MAASMQSCGKTLALLRLSVQQMPVVITQVRHKHHQITRANKFPRTVEFRLMKEITQPIFDNNDFSLLMKEEECPRLRRLNKEKFLDLQEKSQVQKDMLAYEKYMYDLCRWHLMENQMIAVCQPLPCDSNTWRPYGNILRSCGIGYREFKNTLVREIIADTHLRNMAPWINGHMAYLVSKEDKVQDLIQSLKKIPFLLLLGGVVNGRLLSRQELLDYATLPNIEALRGELVSILNLAGGQKTLSVLDSHQQGLTTNLSQYAKQLQESKGDNSDDNICDDSRS